MSGSYVTASMYSEPTYLGELSVGSDGQVDGFVDVGEIPIGRHLLVLSGNSSGGEPVKYYQFIEVWDSPEDADGDGIPNSSDQCAYISHWYDEQTGEDQCVAKSSLSAEDEDSKIESPRVVLSSVGAAGATYTPDESIGSPVIVNERLATAVGDKLELSKKMGRNIGPENGLDSAICKTTWAGWPLLGALAVLAAGGIYVIARLKK